MSIIYILKKVLKRFSNKKIRREKLAVSEDLSEWEIAPTSKMISYGFGYLIINYLLGAYTRIVFYYYEVEVGLPVLYVGLAFVIYAVWNMFNDPLLGYFTDRPRKWTKRWGMRAP